VLFATLNVFGRSSVRATPTGVSTTRTTSLDHHRQIDRGGVVGGLGPVAKDLGNEHRHKTGHRSAADISAFDTLLVWSNLAGIGGRDPSVIRSQFASAVVSGVLR